MDVWVLFESDVLCSLVSVKLPAAEKSAACSEEYEKRFLNEGVPFVGTQLLIPSACS